MSKRASRVAPPGSLSLAALTTQRVAYFFNTREDERSLEVGACRRLYRTWACTSYLLGIRAIRADFSILCPFTFDFL